MAPRTGFPLTAGRPLYSELMNTTLHAPHHHSALHLRRHLSRPPRLRAHSPSSQGSDPPWFAFLLISRALCDDRVVVSLVVDVAFSAAALRLRQLLPVPPIPRASTARSRSPRANEAALDPLAAPPQGVGSALPGRRIAPASAAFLSFSARPSPQSAPPQARGGVALLVVDHGGPAAAATGLPPVSSHVPTPLAKVELARLSPPRRTIQLITVYARSSRPTPPSPAALVRTVLLSDRHKIERDRMR